MKTRKKRGGNFNSGTRRLRSRLRSKLKYFRKKKSRKIYIPKNTEVPPKEEANSQSSKKTPPTRITPKKITPKKYKPIQVVEVEVIGENGKPISMPQNCISITKEEKKILDKGVALTEILNEVADKKKETLILKDILSIDLDSITKNDNHFILLNIIIEILKKHLGFPLRGFVPCSNNLKLKYKSLNDKNLIEILQNLKEEIKTIKTE
jgi:hypothetical protein